MTKEEVKTMLGIDVDDYEEKELHLYDNLGKLILFKFRVHNGVEVVDKGYFFGHVVPHKERSSSIPLLLCSMSRVIPSGWIRRRFSYNNYITFGAEGKARYSKLITLIE